MPTKYLKNIKPGEIWIVELSIMADDTIGHETQKTRPCLVIANNPVANMITIIPLQFFGIRIPKNELEHFLN
ncbi:hypothetical protein LCGC14_1688930 [marine sediment metagenome]|uniref:Type II toxin-antitoxin system PemK/MazF family toxin n=1 Tax=marine sediment metagenome TaxID=412755 RepID=A0A0F9I8Y5_9ZZZZ